jgi:hypothetical protein
MSESDAETVLNAKNHVLEGRAIRVNPAMDSGSDPKIE